MNKGEVEVLGVHGDLQLVGSTLGRGAAGGVGHARDGLRADT